MNKKAYALLKGDKVIGTFHNSKRVIKKLYAKQLAKKGYSIGVFTHSQTLDASQISTITLYTDYMGVYNHKNGETFYAVDDNYRTSMKGLYEFTVDEEDVKEASMNRFFIENIESVEIIGEVK